MFKNALISCSDKTGLAEFLKPYVMSGLRIVSTGGTAKYLKENNISVVDVSAQTGFPEIMDGRVKTLHPNVHMALLARDNNSEDDGILKKFGIEKFDLVIGNLYPFEKVPGIEQIDIGGPSFLRSAAKSFDRITVICDPADYITINETNIKNIDFRKKLAAKVFAHTSSYDSMISSFLYPDGAFEFNDYSIGASFHSRLRYGENPQQKAVWYRRKGEWEGLTSAKQWQGKELSYNNILDSHSALMTLAQFRNHNGPEKAFVAVKHNSPCGVAWGEQPETIVERGIASDSQSIFGGIVAVNFPIEKATAEKLQSLFLECVIAPSFSKEALDVFSAKKNLRVIEYTISPKFLTETRLKSVCGGYLVQEGDKIDRHWNPDWKIHGAQSIDDNIKKQLLNAWRVCANLKSNAIAIADASGTVGLGMGQVNRVDAVEQAIKRMLKFHKKTSPTVLASDAFFPFPDSIELIANAGIRFVIHPGGSVKDNEVLAKAKELGVTTILTGTRHFLH
jgi:phosphoribosylaminoimidazolecarboxamide formyltransferase/IMP cyclohydrolase